MASLPNTASNIYKNKRRLLKKLEKQHLRDLKRRPPNEIIIKIISYLNSPQDIKNCMMINKETRNSIFNRYEYMRQFEFSLDCMLNDWRFGIQFLQDRGSCVRNFRYGLFVGSRPLMRLVLNQMPNLEELRFDNRKSEDVREKKAIVDEESDDCSAGEDDGNQEDLKRKKCGAGGQLEGTSGELEAKNDETSTKSGENVKAGENGESSKSISTPTKFNDNPEASTTNNPNPEDPEDNLTDSDNGFNSDLETEDDDDSDDDSYKNSSHPSDDDDSSIGNESVGEIELDFDESSDEFSSDDEDLEAAKEPAKLSKLKFLRINLEDLTDFVENTQDVKALEKLSVTLSEFKNEEVLVNFLNNQTNLKELELIKYKRLKELNLPTVENPKFSIQLKKLRIKQDCRNYENLANFMNSQVDSLEELEISIGLYRNTQHFRNFFQNATSLTTITLRDGLGKFVRDLDDFRLENVKYFDQKNQSMDLDTIFACFPNLETLKCFATSSIGASYPKLTTLELKIFNLGNSVLAEMPNLKNFAVTMNVKNVNEENWKEFARKYPNIENLTIQTYDYDYIINQSPKVKSLCILENLKLLPKLKTVTYETSPMPRRISEFQYAEDDRDLVKVDINVGKKVAKVSQFFVQNHKEILVKLLNDFEGFRFYEVRPDEQKKVRINAEMFLDVEEVPAKRQKVSE